ncbi:hypothetical protein [Bacillus sp. FJAT-47783]|uniref:hypothetical protein n=1 Tax=Bacillus sp. FJAT-47783 TaxID=2922712 RepID=UPI001FAD3A53|nr:hypothetical protein [Bacillus sp. FJAT-47783]
MTEFLKKHIVMILCILAFISPIIGNLAIDLFYYSSLIGWIIGFVLIVCSYIIVTKSPDDSEGDQHVS